MNRYSLSFRFSLTGTILLFVLSCAALPGSPRFQPFADTITLSGAHWGLAVRSLSTGEFLCKKDETKAFVPASNMKLITTAVALVALGPDFRYTTGLYMGGEVRGGILHGDLFVLGSGDPAIAGSFNGGKAAGVFGEWADALAGKGVREIEGAVTGDASCFDGQSLGAGWPWDDETSGYSAQISCLSFNDNAVEVEVSPGRNTGDPAGIIISPATGYVKVINQAATAPAGTEGSLRFFRQPGTNTIKVSGAIANGSRPLREWVSIDNPARYTATVLKETLESRGIRVHGGIALVGEERKAADYATMKRVAEHISPPLKEIIKITNKLSKNLYAEQMFRTLGKVLGGEGSTAASAGVIRDQLSLMGIPDGPMAVYDGSGFSRLDLMTPLNMVLLLDYMSHHDYFPYFYDSLPVAGVDGTLERRMQGTPAAGRVHAKTGYLRHVRALSGYATAKDGGLIAFSLLVNNYSGTPEDVRAFQDNLCIMLSEYSGVGR